MGDTLGFSTFEQLFPLVSTFGFTKSLQSLEQPKLVLKSL
jgi:hypothetical protein